MMHVENRDLRTVTRDHSALANGSFNRRVHSVVVLRCQAEDSDRSTFVLVCFVSVCRTKQVFERKVGSFDPDSCCVVDCWEDHHSAAVWEVRSEGER